MCKELGLSIAGTCTSSQLSGQIIISISIENLVRMLKIKEIKKLF